MTNTIDRSMPVRSIDKMKIRLSHYGIHYSDGQQLLTLVMGQPDAVEDEVFLERPIVREDDGLIELPMRVIVDVPEANLNVDKEAYDHLFFFLQANLLEIPTLPALVHAKVIWLMQLELHLRKPTVSVCLDSDVHLLIRPSLAWAEAESRTSDIVVHLKTSVDRPYYESVQQPVDFDHPLTRMNVTVSLHALDAVFVSPESTYRGLEWRELDIGFESYQVAPHRARNVLSLTNFEAVTAWAVPVMLFSQRLSRFIAPNPELPRGALEEDAEMLVQADIENADLQVLLLPLGTETRAILVDIFSIKLLLEQRLGFASLVTSIAAEACLVSVIEETHPSLRFRRAPMAICPRNSFLFESATDRPLRFGASNPDIFIALDPSTICVLRDLMKSISAVLASQSAATGAATSSLPLPPDLGMIRSLGARYYTSLETDVALLSITLTHQTQGVDPDEHVKARVDDRTIWIFGLDLLVCPFDQDEPGQLRSVFSSLVHPNLQFVLSQTETLRGWEIAIPDPVLLGLTPDLLAGLVYAIRSFPSLSDEEDSVSREDQISPLPVVNLVQVESARLAKLNLSILDEKQTELCLVTLEDLLVVRRTEATRRTVVADLGNLAVDSMLPKAEYPCLFAKKARATSRKMPIEERDIRRDAGVLVGIENQALMSLTWCTTSPSIDADEGQRPKELVFFTFRPVTIGFEEAALTHIYRAYEVVFGGDSMYLGSREEQDDDEDRAVDVVVHQENDAFLNTDSSDLFEEECPTKDWFVHIAPLDIELSVRPSPANRLPLSSLLSGYQTCSLTCLSILADIDGLNLGLPGMELEAPSSIGRVVVREMMGHAKEVLLGCTTDLFGSAAIIGRPAIALHHLASTVGGGDEGGCNDGCGTRLSHAFSAVWTPFVSIPSGLGTLLAAISLDSTYQQYREELLKSSTASSLGTGARLIAHGLVRPFAMLVDGLRAGCSCELETALSLSARVVLGLVVLPLAGIADAVGALLGSCAAYKSELNEARPTRFPYVLLPAGRPVSRARGGFWSYIFGNLVDRTEGESLEGVIENAYGEIMMWSDRRVITVQVQREEYLPDINDSLPDVPSRAERADFLTNFALQYDVQIGAIFGQELDKGELLSFYYSHVCQETELRFRLRGTTGRGKQNDDIRWGSLSSIPWYSLREKSQ